MGVMANKVHPTESGITSRPVRLNGWSWPPHPLQVLAWIFFLFFAITYFALLVPSLPTVSTRWIAGVISAMAFISHFVVHLVSLSCNPADDNVRAKYAGKLKRKPRNFDPSKHSHVIENQFCYICEVSVGVKSKHCSVCNKCVKEFDHHCNYLNTCIGKRNYRLFIAGVATALLGAIVIFVVSALIAKAAFEQGSWLNQVKDAQNSSAPQMVTKATGPNESGDFSSSSLSLPPSSTPSSPLPSLNGSRGMSSNNGSSSSSSSTSASLSAYQLTWIGLVLLDAVLSLISILLLGHLLCFHLFLYCVGLSTYEFIVQRRSEESADPKTTSGNQEAQSTFVNLFLRFLSSYVFVCCARKKKKNNGKSDTLEKAPSAGGPANYDSNYMERGGGGGSGANNVGKVVVRSPTSKVGSLGEAPTTINSHFVDQIIQSIAEEGKAVESSSSSHEPRSALHLNDEKPNEKTIMSRQQMGNLSRQLQLEQFSENVDIDHGDVYLGSPRRRFYEELKMLGNQARSQQQQQQQQHASLDNHRTVLGHRDPPPRDLSLGDKVWNSSGNFGLNYVPSPTDNGSAKMDIEPRFTRSMVQNNHATRAISEQFDGQSRTSSTFSGEPIFRAIKLPHQPSNGRVSRLAFTPKMYANSPNSATMTNNWTPTSNVFSFDFASSLDNPMSGDHMATYDAMEATDHRLTRGSTLTTTLSSSTMSGSQSSENDVAQFPRQEADVRGHPSLVRRKQNNSMGLIVDDDLGTLENKVIEEDSAATQQQLLLSQARTFSSSSDSSMPNGSAGLALKSVRH